MTTALSRLSGSAFELTITVPWVEVKSVYDQVFSELADEIEIEGFRKGKAPREVVAQKIDKTKILSEVVNRILPQSYTKALDEHHLTPVVSPKIQLVTTAEEKDWQYIARSAEKPSVNLGNYKDAIKSINAKGKIWTPEKGTPDAADAKTADPKGKEEEERSKRISEIIDKLLEICQVDLSDLLVESEVSRLSSQLVDDVRAAGLTYEQYLSSKGQTSDQVKEKFRQQAQATLKLEFILNAVADDLNIQVEKAEIEAIINKEADAEKQKALKEQSYIIASILRRENTISKLLTL